MFAPWTSKPRTMLESQATQPSTFTIVSKDADFNNRAFLFGPPPKVVWIRRGSCSTRELEDLLRARHADVVWFSAEAAAALLILE